MLTSLIEYFDGLLPAHIAEYAHDQHVIGFMLAFLASFGTFIGGICTVFVVYLFGATKRLEKQTNKLIGVFQSFSAGVMLYMTFIDLIPESSEKIGKGATMSWFFVGVVAFFLLDLLIGYLGHSHETPKENSSPKRVTRSTLKQQGSAMSDHQRSLLKTSFVTYIAMALHNLPEGLGVYLSSLSDHKLGLQLALGIMLHNIPEGMAVAIPMWVATKSWSYVLFMTLLNGLAEPLGVILGALLLEPYLTKEFLSICLAVVAGVMACISLHELIPTSIKFSGKSLATTSLFAGMLLSFVVLESVDHMFHH